ncbi:MAG: hypothetical protein WA697_18960 [Pseudolabrys sp.]
MKKLFLVTVSVVALPVVAYAAELPLSMKAPVFAPPPLLTWAGSYVGILGGVAYHRATLNPNCTPDLGCETTELTRTGGTIGTFLGHNWQQGNSFMVSKVIGSAAPRPAKAASKFRSLSTSDG